MKEQELRLAPRETLEGRNNYKRFFIIERDGRIVERVRLHVTDMRTREEIVCNHYLKMLVRHIIRENIGVRVISRDAPWDFQLELSNSNAFGVEIVSIADNQMQFTVTSREERRDERARNQLITLRQLRKHAKQFPDEALDRLITEYVDTGKGPDDLIENPDFMTGPVEGPMHIYVAYGDPVIAPLSERLEQAIAGKSAKRADKDGLVLIIDNRTSLISAVPVIEAAEAIAPAVEASPFREIWFYTGYYSDLDGNNSEYTFIPLKVDDVVRTALETSQS